jgi:hypothetical protein
MRRLLLPAPGGERGVSPGSGMGGLPLTSLPQGRTNISLRPLFQTNRLFSRQLPSHRTYRERCKHCRSTLQSFPRWLSLNTVLLPVLVVWLGLFLRPSFASSPIPYLPPSLDVDFHPIPPFLHSVKSVLSVVLHVVAGRLLRWPVEATFAPSSSSIQHS